MRALFVALVFCVAIGLIDAQMDTRRKQSSGGVRTRAQRRREEEEDQKRRVEEERRRREQEQRRRDEEQRRREEEERRNREERERRRREHEERRRREEEERRRREERNSIAIEDMERRINQRLADEHQVLALSEFLDDLDEPIRNQVAERIRELQERIQAAELLNPEE